MNSVHVAPRPATAGAATTLETVSMHTQRVAPRLALTALLLTALAAAVPLAGCNRWSNYPPIGDDTANNDPNMSPVPQATAAALEWVARKYPVEGPFVINLPQGTTRRTADRILADIGNPSARLVTPESKGLPAFHVTKIWVRESRASIDILRPITNFDAETERGRSPINYQLITVKLLGGPLRPGWRVDAAPRAWPIGAHEPPPLYGWAAEWEQPAGEATSAQPTPEMNPAEAPAPAPDDAPPPM
jgi:hypothetical protein